MKWDGFEMQELRKGQIYFVIPLFTCSIAYITDAQISAILATKGISAISFNLALCSSTASSIFFHWICVFFMQVCLNTHQTHMLCVIFTEELEFRMVYPAECLSLTSRLLTQLLQGQVKWRLSCIWPSPRSFGFRVFRQTLQMLWLQVRPIGSLLIA